MLKQLFEALKPTHAIVRLHDGNTYLFEDEEELNQFVHDNTDKLKEIVRLIAL